MDERVEKWLYDIRFASPARGEILVEGNIFT